MAQQKRHKRANKTGLTANRKIVFWMGIAALAVGGTFFLIFSSPEKPEEQVEGLTEEALSNLPVAPQIGAVAPNFQLTSLEGESMQLRDFKGQPVALIFFHSW